jgi:hypothetical protein
MDFFHINLGMNLKDQAGLRPADSRGRLSPHEPFFPRVAFATRINE